MEFRAPLIACAITFAMTAQTLLSSGQTVIEAKVVLLGSQTVGKSSMVGRFMRGTFSSNTVSTIGAIFVAKTVEVANVQVKLQIWDTGGSERYRSLAPLYCRDAQAGIVVYDVTSSQSFQEVEDIWLTELIEKGPKNIIVALAGNKVDLVEARAVSSTMGESLAKKHKIDIFKETSAGTGQSIEELFAAIAEHVVSTGFVPARPETILDSVRETTEDGCC
jgi:Ras-related protein Rab-5C